MTQYFFALWLCDEHGNPTDIISKHINVNGLIGRWATEARKRKLDGNRFRALDIQSWTFKRVGDLV